MRSVDLEQLGKEHFCPSFDIQYVEQRRVSAYGRNKADSEKRLQKSRLCGPSISAGSFMSIFGNNKVEDRLCHITETV